MLRYMFEFFADKLMPQEKFKKLLLLFIIIQKGLTVYEIMEIVIS